MTGIITDAIQRDMEKFLTAIGPRFERDPVGPTLTYLSTLARGLGGDDGSVRANFVLETVEKLIKNSNDTWLFPNYPTDLEALRQQAEEALLTA